MHTDVPEFRGANRKLFPQWLMVVMHHSGLFERWRMPIATGIAYFSPEAAGHARGRRAGLLARRRRRRRRGAADPAQHRHRARHRLGVPRRRPGRARRTPSRSPAPGNVLEHDGERGCCRPEAGSDEVLAAFGWGDIRFSVSWKAYCFADEAERDAWRTHADDLDLDVILAELVTDLRARGVLTVDELSERDLALAADRHLRALPRPTPG